MSSRNQQELVYIAESDLSVSRVGLEEVRAAHRVRPLAELKSVADEWRDLMWWVQWYPLVKELEVCARPVGSRSSLGHFEAELHTGFVELLPQHHNLITLSHETAHVLAQARYGSASHDPWWARVYLELTYWGIGSATYYALWQSFEKHGVEHDV